MARRRSGRCAAIRASSPADVAGLRRASASGSSGGGGWGSSHGSKDSAIDVGVIVFQGYNFLPSAEMEAPLVLGLIGRSRTENRY